MVVLVLNDIDQISFLELEMDKSGIKYQKVLKQTPPLTPPFLIVDGVPLDFNRSLKWIKEHDNR